MASQVRLQRKTVCTCSRWAQKNKMLWEKNVCLFNINCGNCAMFFYFSGIIWIKNEIINAHETRCLINCSCSACHRTMKSILRGIFKDTNRTVRIVTFMSKALYSFSLRFNHFELANKWHWMKWCADSALHLTQVEVALNSIC